MIRFIDLGKQIAVDENDPEWPRQFAFYDTISDSFISVNGGQVFDSWRDFDTYANGELTPEFILRCKSLCPPWLFDVDMKTEAEQQRKAESELKR